ncbi:hypothetical protein [Pontiella agarivorans]|uniref:Uncharacterized protein n=1 Tax=Pontiella agarivorans TaxID=3038953 RepID=A0ABU5MWM0_9BACT|nr:hypothetical protein [Pontiella agarivorans]MDZ8118346.1 hypothetical protein [Pontiella agarivorans]
MSRILIKDGPGTPIVGAVLITESLQDRRRSLPGRASLDPEYGMLLRPWQLAFAPRKTASVLETGTLVRVQQENT